MLGIHLICIEGVNFYIFISVNNRVKTKSELFLPLPSLVPGRSSVFITLKVNISAWNPGTHSKSSVANATSWKNGEKHNFSIYTHSWLNQC